VRRANRARIICTAFTLEEEFELGVFEFLIVLVVVSTIGKVVTDFGQRRQLPRDVSPGGGGEVSGLRDEIADLSGRLQLLEEERDFYRNLLEAPKGDATQPPDET
jgi:hypothetical protein